MTGAPWGPLPPSTDRWTSFRVGECTIWTHSVQDEWEIAHEHRNGACADAGPVPGDPGSWTRYVTTADDQLETRPALPDRPVVVRPAAPIVILPGRWGRFYFAVPLWVRFVCHPHGRETVMEEVASRQLTSIWFGTPASGELCYSIESPLVREAEHMEVDDSLAVCEIVVKNQSRERLKFERLCVHVESMKLFSAAGGYWTNEVRVAFRGADQASQLTFQPGPPEHVTDPLVQSEPRVAPEAGLLKRSFAFIREITGI